MRIVPECIFRDMSNETRTPKLTRLADMIGELRTDAEAAYNAKQAGRPRGPVTGLSKLDAALGGYLQPGLHVLQAAPGAGKTAFALQAAATCKFPALIVSAEMPTIELFRRLIARETQTFLGKLKTGELGPLEVERLARETAEKLPRLAILDGQRGFASSEIIRENAEDLREDLKADHCLIIIDSLQIWARSSRGPMSAPASEYDVLNQSLVTASDIAADLACPILLVSHRNRAGQDKGGMHASKGSGDIEYLTETVIDLERNKDDRPDAAGEIDIQARIHKNRNGVAGVSMGLKFCGRIQQFREV